MNQSAKVFFPNLDGLRFIAFFAVFLNHALFTVGYYNDNKYFEFIKNNFMKNGDLGVSFFFVLSGFLITYLLLSEKEITGRINIKNFYIRRVLRIWPVYFLVVLLCLYVFPKLNNHLPAYFPIGVSVAKLNPWLYVGFAGNFDYILHGISNVLIGVLWSVSIEEQFYLFWCPVIAFIPKKYLLPSFLAVIVCSILFRYFYTDGNAMLLKYHSLSCMSDLAIGAVIAYLATKENVINRIKQIKKYQIILVYLVGIILIPFRLYTWKFGVHYVLAASFAPIVFAAFFAFIIMEQNYAEHSFYKISRFKSISSLGKYTYGMYCYHMLVFFVLLFSLHWLGATVIFMNKYGFTCLIITSLFATMFVSMLSYRYFELWFLKLKERFSSLKKY